MKNIFIKPIFLSILSIGLFTSCVNDDEFAIPKIIPVYFSEDFNQIDFNQDFDYEGWTNFAETGSKVWIERDFNNDGYAQFSSFSSGDASNIGWLVTPTINIGSAGDASLSFSSASNFVTSPDNKLEVFVSSDYDGTNVLGATWIKLDAKVADSTTNKYTYIPSGPIDLSSYSGNIHIAFKVTGNSTSLTGLFQVDKVKVFSLN
jgi:hypothetical protein